MEFFLALEEEVSNWWEPNTPGVLDIGDVSVFLGAIIAFSTVFMMVSKWLMKALRKIVREEIAVATEPIHPNSNGGLSLADVARKAIALEKQIKTLERYNKQTYDLVKELAAQPEKKNKPTSTRRPRKPKD